MSVVPEEQLAPAPAPQTATSTLQQARAEDTPQSDDAPRHSPSPSWNRVMRVVRRIHLYSGLFMFPWVLLYGVTGMFFNHPRSFHGGEQKAFTSADLQQAQIAELPTPSAVAQHAVDQLNAAMDAADEPRVILTDARDPEFSSDFTFTVQAEKTQHTVSWNPVTGAGQVQSVPTANESAANSAANNLLSDVARVQMEVNSLASAQSAVPALLEQLDLPTGEVSPGRRAPNLVFSAEIDGKPAVLSCNLGNGFVRAVAEDTPSDMSTKQFMQRLHLARTYPPQQNVRWLWAISVDAMFASMVFWGCSGLFMWWQIKRTRWLGAGVIGASLLCAAFLAVGMHDSLTMAGGRGQGGGGQGGGGGHSHGPGGGGGRGAADSEATDGEDEMPQRGQRGNRGRGGFGGGRGGFGGNRGGFGGPGGRRGQGARQQRPSEPSSAEDNALETSTEVSPVETEPTPADTASERS